MCKLAMFVILFFLGILHCDCRKCFSVTRGNKTRTYKGVKLRHGSFRFKKTNHDFQVPQKAVILHTNGSSVSWRSRSEKWPKPKHFLLRIERLVVDNGSPLEKEEMILLGPLKTGKENVYSYNCVNIANTTWVKFTIWSLGNVKKEKEKTVFNVNDFRVAYRKWDAPDPVEQAARARAIACVCKSNIMVNKVFSFDAKLTARVMVYNAMYQFQLHFFLNRNVDGKEVTIKNWLDTTDAKQNITTLETNWSIPFGKYKLKVQKRCGDAERLGCYRQERERNYYWSSNIYDYNSQDLEKAADLITSGVFHVDTNKTRDSGISIEHLHVKMGPAAIAGVSAGIVGSIALIYVIYIVCLTKKKKQFGVMDVTSHLDGDIFSNKNDSVAVIYVNDSPSHTERVAKLCSELESKGLSVAKIDEQTRREGMFRNWRTEGEYIFKTHGSFIFVLSPGLLDACKPPGQNQITAGSKVPEVYSKVTSVGFTNIPRLILDCIKNYQSLYGRTSLQTVYFCDQSRSSDVIRNVICNSFAADHISVMGTKPISLKVNNSGDILERDVLELVVRLRGQKTFEVRVCTTVV